MNVLSPDFLRSRGIQINQALGEWLGRASFILRTRQSEADRQRYQNWVLCMIEDAIDAGGITSKDWAKQSPTIPAHADVRLPRLLTASTAPAPSAIRATCNPHPHVVVPQQYPAPYPAQPIDYRSQLMEECARRCPTELRPFLRAAFDIIDQELHAARGLYNTVSFLRVLKVADQLRISQIQQQQRMQMPPVSVAAPPTYAPPWSCAPTAVEVFRPSKRERAESPPAAHSGFPETLGVFQRIANDAPKQKSKCKFVGKSQALERKYSRDEPLPADIRPLSVLKKAFDHIFQQSLEKCKSQDGMKYLAEQLKGMRQDLRVQNIKNSFSIAVYESSAKTSLAVGDVGDFNQCQASLKVLYRELPNSKGSVEEFTWYRLAYLAFGGQHDALALEIVELNVPEKTAHGVLALCVAIAEGEGCQVVEQCLRCPAGHMKSLASLFLQRHRIAWLGAVASGARGPISSKMIVHALGFHAFLPDTRQLSREDASRVLSKRAGKVLFDGSLEGASENFREILTLLKVPIPDQLDVAADILAIACGSCSTSAAFDAQLLSSAVLTYNQFLTTRRDALSGASADD